MSHSQNNSEPHVRAVMGESTRYQVDLPLDMEEANNFRQMLQSANKRLSDKSLRALALLVTSKVQAINFTGQPNLDARQTWVDSCISNLFDLILEHLRYVRFDLNNAIFYNPWTETWLLKEGSDFNTAVEKNLSRSLRFVTQERALLTSGLYPNRELLQKAIDCAFAKRNKFEDLPMNAAAARLEQSRQAELPSLNSDSPNFELSFKEIEEHIFVLAQNTNTKERGAWEEMLELQIFEQRLARLDLTPRSKTGVDDFLWKARPPLLRKLDSDGNDMSFWNVMDIKPGSVGRFLRGPRDNNYAADALDELMKVLNADLLDRTGVSAHEIQIENSRKILQLNEPAGTRLDGIQVDAELEDDDGENNDEVSEEDLANFPEEAQQAYRVYVEHRNSVKYDIQNPPTTEAELRAWATERAEHLEQCRDLFLAFVAACNPALALLMAEMDEETEDDGDETEEAEDEEMM